MLPWRPAIGPYYPAIGPHYNYCRFKEVLFDTLPIGARMIVGVDSSQWVGNFGGVVDGVLFLTNAQLFSNIGTPDTGILSVVRIPIHNLQFISY